MTYVSCDMCRRECYIDMRANEKIFEGLCYACIRMLSIFFGREKDFGEMIYSQMEGEEAESIFRIKFGLEAN